jgi:hypothetical protein
MFESTDIKVTPEQRQEIQRHPSIGDGAKSDKVFIGAVGVGDTEEGTMASRRRLVKRAQQAL